MASVLKIVATNYLGAAGTTVDFISGGVYRITSWSPAVAQRRVGEFGRGPYEDVEETMTIVISGATALASLTALQAVLNQARRWARGEPVGVVLLHYKPTASSDELQTPLLGGVVELPSNFVNAPVVTVIDPVTVTFTRAGLWYGAETALTDTTTTNPETAQVATFAALGASAPVKVELEGIELNKASVNGSFLLVSSDEASAGAASRIVVMSAESLVGNTGYTSVADASKFARGNVLRFTPSGTPGEAFETIAPAGFTYNSRVRRWGVFVNYRNNSATTSFQVWAKLWHTYLNGGPGYTDTPRLIVPAGTSNPQWAFVGGGTLPDSLARVSLMMEASAASGSLDIDDVVVVAQDYPDSDIALRLGGALGSISLTTTLVIDPAVLSRLMPAVYITENDTPQWLSYLGPAYLSMRENATSIAVAWLTNGYSSATYWRALDTGNSPQNPLVRVTRTAAYLTPR